MNYKIPSKVSNLITQLNEYSPDGFIFSYNGGESPIYYKTITAGLYTAMGNIGISDAERREFFHCRDFRG